MDVQIGYNGDAKREDLIRILERGEALVAFTKVNGEERNMRCTLAPSLLPERQDKSKAGYHTDVTGTLAVWDIVKKDWRAFRVASVKEIYYRERL